MIQIQGMDQIILAFQLHLGKPGMLIWARLESALIWPRAALNVFPNGIVYRSISDQLPLFE